MKRIILVCLLLITKMAFAIENEIRVLALYTGGANKSFAEIQLGFMTANWPASSFNISTTVKVVNGGQLIQLTPTTYTGTAASQLNAAKSMAYWQQLRDQHSADVIFLFTGQVSDIHSCGKAVQKNWTTIDDPLPGNFVSDANGLDLNGADHSYYAIVATNSKDLCNQHLEIAMHELGHLLGAGHSRDSTPQGSYLTSTSHAWVTASSFLGYRTVTAVANPPQCVIQGITCQLLEGFSNVGNDKNIDTVRQTARSVANYYRTVSGGGSTGGGSGGGSCDLSPVSLLNGGPVNSCTPEFWTQHALSWSGNCPTYQIWYSQPDGSPARYGWSVSSSSSPVYIKGAHSRVRVRACNGSGQCGADSVGSYLASYNC